MRRAAKLPCPDAEEASLLLRALKVVFCSEIKTFLEQTKYKGFSGSTRNWERLWPVEGRF
ncbi:hypothetical protein NBRC116602_29280 [Hyphomicrobiales bacterium 4NK60-0047b]